MAVLLGRKSGGAGGGGGPPSGAAGGALSGTFPNPALSAAKQAELDAKVPKSLYDANTVLAANSDDTPAAVTMGASTILARLAAGNIVAASVAQIVTLLSALQVTIIDAKGDLIAGTGADAAARLAAGANDTVLVADSAQSTGLKYAQIATAQIAAAAGILVSQLGDVGAGKVLTSAGSGNIANYPPGYQFDRSSRTTDGTSTASTAASATTILTCNSITFDGATVVRIVIVSSGIENNTANGTSQVDIWRGSTDIGTIAVAQVGVAGQCYPLAGEMQDTPSAAAHVYTARLWVTGGTTGSVRAGAGGAGTRVPASLKVLKV